MRLVLLTALGVGGATVFGAVIGFFFKKISHRFSDIVLAFAAGVMLAAAIRNRITSLTIDFINDPILFYDMIIFCNVQ